MKSRGGKKGEGKANTHWENETEVNEERYVEK